ncbi:hypothetical protein D3C72_2457770 [compost metagenome]
MVVGLGQLAEDHALAGAHQEQGIVQVEDHLDPLTALDGGDRRGRELGQRTRVDGGNRVKGGGKRHRANVSLSWET